MTQSAIHPSAVVHPTAKIGEGVKIGPFCVVGARVVLGDDVQLMSHVVVEGVTTIGPRTKIFPFASIGHIPQDLKFGGEESRLEIGSDCNIREHVTINPGTKGGGLLTKVGDRVLLMVAAHVAHDCIIGNDVIVVNNVLLGGHVVIEDQAIIGGQSAVHQFVRIGRNAMIGGMTGVEQDVIPFGLAMGDRGHLAGLNLVGLRRGDFSRDEVNGIRAAFKHLFEGEGEMSSRIEDVSAEYGTLETVQAVLQFLSNSDRKVLKPRDFNG